MADYSGLRVNDTTPTDRHLGVLSFGHANPGSRIASRRVSHNSEPPHPYEPPMSAPYAGYQPVVPPTWAQQPAAPVVPVYYGYPVQAVQKPTASGMYVAAAVINWVVFGLLVLGTCGIGLVAAAWFVPMTIYIHKGANDRVKHTALGVCTLLFCNIVSGILMLVEDSNRPS